MIGLGGAHTLQEERQESDEEDQKDGDDAALNPLEDLVQVVARSLVAEHVAVLVQFTNLERLVQCTNEHHWKTHVSFDRQVYELNATYGSP